MKHLILSADSTPSVYLVPDGVADNLEYFCEKFWQWQQGGCYTEQDFIEYLNEWIFPDTPSQFVEKLDDSNDELWHRLWHLRQLPEKYKDCKWFNF